LLIFAFRTIKESRHYRFYWNWNHISSPISLKVWLKQKLLW